MRMVLDGKPNKTIAHHLGLSVRTIDFRRASILAKDAGWLVGRAGPYADARRVIHFARPRSD